MRIKEEIMRNTAERIEADQPVLEYCTVVGEKNGVWTVSAGGAVYTAKRAAGCLLKPEKNDTVLLSIANKGPCYILSVLERTGRKAASSTLSFEGNVNLDVHSGSLRVFADEGIALTTPEAMAMTSDDMGINARTASANVGKLSFLAEAFDGRIQKIKLIADAIDSVFRRAVERFVTSYRYVEKHEEIQSRSTRMLIDETLTMQTKNTVHIAEEHVKIDAEQIHLG